MMMRTRFLLRYVVVCVVGVLCGRAEAQRGGVELFLQWEPGDERRYVVEEDMVQEVSGESGATLHWNRRIGFTERVVSSEHGVATVERRYDSVRVEVEGEAIEDAVWDSEDAATDDAKSNPMIAPFAGMVGQVVRFTVDEEGKVLSASGGSALWGGMLDGFAGSAIGDATSGAAPADEALRAQIEQGLKAVPNRKVRPRESWEVETDHATPIGAVRSEIEYTFDRVRRQRGGKVAQISAEGKLSMPEGGGGGLAALLGAIAITDSSVEGSLQLDTERGVIVRSELVVRSSWGLELGEEYKDLLGDESSQTITQRAVMELVADE